MERQEDFLAPSPVDAAAKAGKPEPSVKVTVAQWTQIGHDGVVYRGGETFAAPASLAATWVAYGWAVAIRTTPGRAEGA